ncbi:MAG TPA: NADP-dependent oxidoreductase [Ktedonobacterales bacterium]
MAAAQHQTMRALLLHERGGPEQLVYGEAPRPPLAIDDALVRVHAASITPTELRWPSTWEDRAGRSRLPVIPSHEVAGVVTELGYGTTSVTVGMAVYGLTDWYRNGAAAEYLAVEARDLAPMPASLTFAEAAAVPLAGLTAWQALFDHGHLAAGQTVLIHGASGGVGTFAVQIAHFTGGHVIATGRAWARQLVLGLGADEYIDLDQQPFEQVVGTTVDLAVDFVGGELLRRSWAVVKPGGALISAVADPRAAATARPDVRSVFFVVAPDRIELGALAQRLDAGELRPIVGGVFPLADGRAAFEAKHRSEADRGAGAPGKVVLAVADAQAHATPSQQAP